jgi:hypothetical protein
MRARTPIALLAAACAVPAVLAASSPAGSGPVYRTLQAKNGAAVGQVTTGTVTCPAGYHMLSGGYRAGTRISVVSSYPVSGGWAVASVSADSSPHVFTIYVRCRR